MTNVAVTTGAAPVLDEKAQKKTLARIITRNWWLLFVNSYTKLEGTTFARVMMPFLEDIYGKETDEFYEAMKRHSNFFNTTPMVNPFILALVVTMEYERKAAIDAGKEFDDNSIESLKVALMGPFAGIGDSIAVGVLRILATGIALGFSQQGLWLGPILFLLVYNIPNLLIQWFTGTLGMKLGSNFVAEALESGMIASFTKGLNVLGMLMVGAMTASFVSFKTSLVLDMGSGVTFDLQSVLNQIMPGILPLSLTLGIFFYLRKKNRPMLVILLIFVVAIILTALGVCG